jgi:hypothetical protein
MVKPNSRKEDRGNKGNKSEIGNCKGLRRKIFCIKVEGKVESTTWFEDVSSGRRILIKGEEN